MTATGRDLAPADLRCLAEAGAWRGPTSGACVGYLQANLVVLPAADAPAFAGLCAANPRPLPLVERTEPGVPDDLAVAPGADLRRSLPRYRVHREGRMVEERVDVADLWSPDLVGFLLGCSFTAEAALLAAGVRLRHLDLGGNVPMYATTLACTPVGGFHGPVVVSMRPIRRHQVDLARQVTAAYPLAHGAPLHVGDPAAIGIADLGRPDWGHPATPEGDEVPVFWACGVTPQAVIAAARPALAITHAPGHMLVTDVPEETLRDRPPLAEGHTTLPGLARPA